MNVKTPEDFFWWLVLQDELPGPGNYVYPCKEWDAKRGWLIFKDRLLVFTSALGSRVTWCPVNGSTSNSATASLNTDPGRALAERWANGFDAWIELMRKLSDDKGPMPRSPREAIERYGKLTLEDVSYKMSDFDVREKIAKKIMITRTFVKNNLADPRDCIIDVRDFGIGMDAEDMETNALAYHKGHKRGLPYLIGKYGQGASNTYSFGVYTILASRKHSTNKVVMTIVRQSWDAKDMDGGDMRDATYEFLKVDGKLIEVEVDDATFPVGTLVRHIGYDKSNDERQGSDSLYGLAQRMFPEMPLPHWVAIHEGKTSDKNNKEVRPYYQNGHVVRGSVNMLNRGWTLGEEVQDKAHNLSKPVYAGSESFNLGPYTPIESDQSIDLGKVEFNFWVASKEKVKGGERQENDALKNFVDARNPIFFTLDGQNHGELPRMFLTTSEYAGLFSVGRWMIVQIKCDDLHPRVKGDLFISSRERVKDTPWYRMIVNELVRRLKHHKRLNELNTEMAKSKVDDDSVSQDKFSSILQAYLQRSGINFQTITRYVKNTLDKDKTINGNGPSGQKELPPITPKPDPTFLKWVIANTSIRMYPGQRYGWRLETDAPVDFWDNSAVYPDSKISLSTSGGVRYLGGDGTMSGGRFMVHFECDEKAKVGSKAAINAMLYWSPSAPPIIATLNVEVVEKHETKPKPSGTKGKGGGDGVGASSTATNSNDHDAQEVSFPILQPIPLTRADPRWYDILAWEDALDDYGFSVKRDGGGVYLYYSAENPLFLHTFRYMERNNLSADFVNLFHCKLVTHIAIAMNTDMPDEEAEKTPEGVRRLRAYFCSVMKTLVLEAMKEGCMRRDAEKAAA